MTAALVALATTLTTPAFPPPGPNGAGNPVYAEVRARGFALGGVPAALPEPVLPDGASADAERDVLRKTAGSERAVSDFTRNSVTAPQVLRTRDEPVKGRGVVRFADLSFVVYARLSDVEQAEAGAGGVEGQTVEAGNMRFTGAELGRDALAARKIEPAEPGGGFREWYVHTTGRLLDRIHVEGTSRATATRSEASWLIASRTDPRFDGDKAAPNVWHPITRKGGREEAGADETYPGGASYVKVTPLATVPGALFVEAHIVFFEPEGWFRGAPVLKSKISLIAQDRIRHLRRELAASRGESGARKPSAPGAVEGRNDR